MEVLALHCWASQAQRQPTFDLPPSSKTLSSHCQFNQTLSSKDRKIKFIVEAEPLVMEEVLYRIIPLIGADRPFQEPE